MAPQSHRTWSQRTPRVCMVKVRAMARSKGGLLAWQEHIANPSWESINMGETRQSAV